MVLVEFSTGGKSVRLGVLFTRNHANHTKICTLKSRSNFFYRYGRKIERQGVNIVTG